MSVDVLVPHGLEVTVAVLYFPLLYTRRTARGEARCPVRALAGGEGRRSGDERRWPAGFRSSSNASTGQWRGEGRGVHALREGKGDALSGVDVHPDIERKLAVRNGRVETILATH